MPGYFRIKSVEQSIQDTDHPDHKLRKNLSALDLTVFGVGVVIGTGIFVLTGQQAALNAGPSIVISFIIAAVVCGLAAMCYAEFASTVPVAGSAYTFSYATLGEVVAWIIGWDLALELALGAAVVSRGWSSYLQSLLDLPTTLFGDSAPVDLGAIFIVVVLSIFAVVGIKLSSRLLNVLVAVKVTVVLLVIIVGFFYVKASNYNPFIPEGVTLKLGDTDVLTTPLLQVFTGSHTVFGVSGIIAAAAVVFFSFIGFDIVATSAEETRNPQRDLPRGIIGSLVVCTILYVLVCIVITGMVKYNATHVVDGKEELKLNTAAPLADAFKEVGAGWAASIIALGGVVGITTVILVLLLGQSRVLFAMSRDGLLPQSLAKVHPKFGTPSRIQIGTGVVVAVLAAVVPLAELSHLVSIGTLFAFIVVSIGVIVLRRTRPDLDRSFRTPGVPVLPILSVLACLYLMLNLPLESILRFLAWMVIGVVFYFVYGHRKSRLAKEGRAAQSPSAAATDDTGGGSTT